MQVTEKALRVGIDAALGDNTVGDIGHAVESFVRAQGGNAMKEAGTTAKSGGAASQMQRDVKSASQSNAPQGSQAKANQSASTSKLSGAQQQLQNLQARQQQTMGGTGRAKSQ